MTLKRFTWFTFVAGAAVLAAHFSVQKELLGARPTWFPSGADYPPSPGVRRDLESASALEECGEGPVHGETSPPVGREEDVTPEKADPPEGQKSETPPDSKNGADVRPPSDLRFPAGLPAKGLDRFLRDAFEAYTVRPGDTLSGIGKAFGVTHTLLANINGLENHRIKADSVLQAVRGPFHVLVLRERKRLRLYAGSVFVKEYVVAVGQAGCETVLGEFRVRTKAVNPDWTDPENRRLVPFGSRKNPLGTRWIGFADGYGIHGTWDPGSLGKASSRGCIRMANPDVEELFDLVVRKASVVKIIVGEGDVWACLEKKEEIPVKKGPDSADGENKEIE
ncbi:MAG: L,D-transpeptidase family protein [Planctomycetota bacterium]|jgi:hypothetical protein